jgi:uncharacterized surface protein with fasciclin (FAS1) repeats
MRSRIITAAVVAALTITACGDDADDRTSATTAAETAPETAPATTTGESTPAAAADIVDTAIGAGSFTTLVAAVQAAGLEETLRGEGPFTVFAPSDDAFAKLPAETLTALMADPTGDLKGILTYHVVPSKVMAADVVGLAGTEVTTVNGATFTVNVDGDKVSLTDAAGNTVNVVKTDIETSNGVIHVIDGVLLPG